MKRCGRCEQTLPLEDFNRYSKSKSGRQAWCRRCTAAYEEVYRRQRVYGVSPDDIVSLLERQGDACGICGTGIDRSAHLDHCHTTNTVRGLLCLNCNTGLGKFKDDEGLLLRAITYLRRTRREQLKEVA